MNAIDKAVATATSATAFATQLGISRQLLHMWQKNKRCPAHWALKVEAASGVSRHELRPDIYGEAP